MCLYVCVCSSTLVDLMNYMYKACSNGKAMCGNIMLYDISKTCVAIFEKCLSCTEIVA